ncbi:hypothetical protein EVAR_68480_1 [Eumeta japonica]|uniref:Uncharacterized protein n=1 Tax=Eumeta variegata TaxID=151549 RepID=A0A4C2A6L6_EUMVA|nr:hypothetical protein EVAR_68480_1 [Eumeta japonica]
MIDLLIVNQEKKGEIAVFVLTKTIERKSIQPGMVVCVDAALSTRGRPVYFGTTKERSGRTPEAAIDADLDATAGGSRRTSC